MDGKITSYHWLTCQELSLKHLCRESIRKHLLEMDPHTNLFDRVPKLGLSSLLSAYVLYNQTLDDEDDDDENDLRSNGNEDDDSDESLFFDCDDCGWLVFD